MPSPDRDCADGTGPAQVAIRIIAEAHGTARKRAVDLQPPVSTSVEPVNV